MPGQMVDAATSRPGEGTLLGEGDRCGTYTLRAVWPQRPPVIFEQLLERELPAVPSIGDTIQVPDGSPGGQSVTINGRIFELDGSVTLESWDFGQWTENDLEAAGFRRKLG